MMNWGNYFKIEGKGGRVEGGKKTLRAKTDVARPPVPETNVGREKRRGLMVIGYGCGTGINSEYAWTC